MTDETTTTPEAGQRGSLIPCEPGTLYVRVCEEGSEEIQALWIVALQLGKEPLALDPQSGAARAVLDVAESHNLSFVGAHNSVWRAKTPWTAVVTDPPASMVPVRKAPSRKVVALR